MVYTVYTRTHFLIHTLLYTPQSQGLEDTTKPGSVLALSNLSYRGLGHTHNLPTCNAGDCAVFSQKPREQHLKDALADLNKNLPVSYNLQHAPVTLHDTGIPPERNPNWVLNAIQLSYSFKLHPFLLMFI